MPPPIDEELPAPPSAPVGAPAGPSVDVPVEPADRAWLQGSDVAPPGVPGPKALGFDFRRRGHFGVGATAGTFLDGLSVKGMVSARDAVQVSVGLAVGPFTYWRRPAVGLAVDYLHEADLLVDGDEVAVAWNIGIALSTRVGPPGRGRNDALSVGIGLGPVAGIEVLLRRVPVDLTFEYRPGVLLTLGQDAGLGFVYGDLAVSARWWF